MGRVPETTMRPPERVDFEGSAGAQRSERKIVRNEGEGRVTRTGRRSPQGLRKDGACVLGVQRVGEGEKHLITGTPAESS